MNMKTFGKRLLAAVVTSSMIVTPVMAAPSVDELKENKQAAQSEVNSLQSQLNDIVSKIDQLEVDLIAKGEEITQAEKDLAEAEALEQQQYEDMKLRIKFMYEEGDTSFVESLVDADSFTDLVNKAEYVQNVHSYDRQKLEEYVETKQKVADLKSTLEEEKSELESKQVEFESQQADLDNLIASKQSEIANLDIQIEDAIAKAAAEAEAKRQQELAAAAQNNKNNNSNGGNNSSKGDSNNGNSGGGSAPSYNASTGNAVVNRAYSKLGCAYVYGATGPNTFDCSGLVSYCLTGSYSRIGTSATFAGWPKVSNPQPGDICVKPGHVGIYIGGGQMIHAPHTGDVVKISSVQAGMWYVRR